MNVQTLSFRRQSSQPSGVLFAPLLVCFANFILLFFFSFIFFCLLSFVVGNGGLTMQPRWPETHDSLVSSSSLNVFKNKLLLFCDF